MCFHRLFPKWTSTLHRPRHSFPLGGDGPWVDALCRCCPLVDSDCSATVESRIKLLFLEPQFCLGIAYMWREFRSLTIGDPNPCQRPTSIWLPRHTLHCPALEKWGYTLLTAEFVSCRTLIMAYKHCCSDSCSLVPGREHLDGYLVCCGPCLGPGL